MTAQTVTTKNNSSIVQNNRSPVMRRPGRRKKNPVLPYLLILPAPGEELLLAGDLDHGEDGGNQSGIHLSDCFIVRTAGNEEDQIFQNLSDNVRIAYGDRFISGGSNFPVYLPAEKRTPE